MTPSRPDPGQKGTGPVRVAAAGLCRPAAPCNHACPAGREHPGWLALAQAGKYRAGLGNAGARQPAAGDAWPGLLSPVRKRLQSRRAGRAGQHPCGRAFPRRPRGRSEGWHARRSTPRRRGKRVLVVGAGPSGLSAAYHLTRLGHTVEIHEAGPVPGGMMHFGIPAYRLPRADLMHEIARIEAHGRQDRAEPQGRGRAGGDSARATSTRSSSRSARMCRQARRYPGARRGARARRRVAAARRRRPARRRCSAAAWSSTAAATPRWTPRAPRGGSAPRRR